MPRLLITQGPRILKEASLNWWQNKAPRMGASLAFYSVLSLAPLVILLTPIVAFFFEDQAPKAIIGQFEQLIGRAGALALEAMVDVGPGQSSSRLATILNSAVLLFAASNVFAELQDAMDTVWGVAAAPRRSAIWSFLRQRFLSFAMVMGVCFLLLVSLFISAGLAVLQKYIDERLQLVARAWSFTHDGASLAIIALLFALIFRFLPDATVKWRDVYVGAIMTAVLFWLGKFAIGRYIGNAVTEQRYGGATSLVALLVWVFYSAQILIFGAEFTHAYAKVRGSRVVPTPDAVPLTPEARAQQGIPTAEQVEQTVKYIEAVRPELRPEATDGAPKPE